MSLKCVSLIMCRAACRRSELTCCVTATRPHVGLINARRSIGCSRMWCTGVGHPAPFCGWLHDASWEGIALLLDAAVLLLLGAGICTSVESCMVNTGQDSPIGCLGCWLHDLPECLPKGGLGWFLTRLVARAVLNVAVRSIWPLVLHWQGLMTCVCIGPVTCYRRSIRRPITHACCLLEGGGKFSRLLADL